MTQNDALQETRKMLTGIVDGYLIACLMAPLILWPSDEHILGLVVDSPVLFVVVLLYGFAGCLILWRVKMALQHQG